MLVKHKREITGLASTDAVPAKTRERFSCVSRKDDSDPQFVNLTMLVFLRKTDAEPHAEAGRVPEGSLQARTKLDFFASM